MNKGMAILGAVLLAMASSDAGSQPTSNRIHAVGYSMTADAICGTNGLFFLDRSGLECELYREYGGGTVERWWSLIGPPAGAKWTIFQSGIEFNGQPEAIFWQIAYKLPDGPTVSPGDFQRLQDVLSQIRLRAPGVPIFVSGMTPYSHSQCPTVSEAAIEKSWDAAGILWATEADVHMGPVLPTIRPHGEDALADQCHLTRKVRIEHGAKLHEFFDPILVE